jgi:hypothetical protein
VRHQAIEDETLVLVGIETQVREVAEKASALGNAETKGAMKGRLAGDTKGISLAGII